MADPGYVDLPASKYFTFEYKMGWDPVNAAAIGAELKATADNDYTSILDWFPPLALSSQLPFKVMIDQAGTTNGLDAWASNDTYKNITLFLGFQILQPANIDRARECLVAEFAEIFMVAQNKGWVPGYSHGESLSRFAAYARYPDIAPFWSGPDVWLGTAWQNWINSTEDTDTDPVSHGCGLLFLYYVHTVLGYSPARIVAAAAPTLSQAYTRLTGKNDAFTAFTELLATRFKPNIAAQIVGSTNPFPFVSTIGTPPVTITPPPPTKLTCGGLQLMIDQLEAKKNRTTADIGTLQTYKNLYASQCDGADPGKPVIPKVGHEPFPKPPEGLEP